MVKTLSEKGETDLTDCETQFFRNVEWKTVDEVVELLETYPADPRGRILHRRDMLAIREAKKMIYINKFRL